MLRLSSELLGGGMPLIPSTGHGIGAHRILNEVLHLILSKRGVLAARRIVIKVFTNFYQKHKQKRRCNINPPSTPADSKACSCARPGEDNDSPQLRGIERRDTHTSVPSGPQISGVPSTSTTLPGSPCDEVVSEHLCAQLLASPKR